MPVRDNRYAQQFARMVVLGHKTRASLRDEEYPAQIYTAVAIILAAKEEFLEWPALIVKVPYGRLLQELLFQGVVNRWLDPKDLPNLTVLTTQSAKLGLHRQIEGRRIQLTPPLELVEIVEKHAWRNPRHYARFLGEVAAGADTERRWHEEHRSRQEALTLARVGNLQELVARVAQWYGRDGLLLLRQCVDDALGRKR